MSDPERNQGEGANQKTPAKPTTSQFVNLPLTRRRFLQALGLTVLGTTAILEAACEPSQPKLKLEEIKPTTDSEKQMFETLQVYSRIQSQTQLKSEQAATVTHAALSANNESGSISNFAFFKTLPGVKDEDEAAVLTVTSQIDEAGRDNVARLLEEARKLNPDDELKAVNISTIATFTRKEVAAVATEYGEVDKSQGEKEFVPILTVEKLTEGNLEYAHSTLNKAKEANITDKQDISGILYASTFVNAELDDILKIYKELESMGVGVNVRGDLLVAAVFNGLNLEEVTEMYNFAGALEGVSQEAAVKLVLATITRNMQTPEFQEKLKLRHPVAAAPRGGIYGYYHPLSYWGSYGSYNQPRTSSSFYSTKSPSFSKPGVSPVRGTGGTYGGARGTTISGGRGGISSSGGTSGGG